MLRSPSAIEPALLEVIWAQWIALGVDALGAGDVRVVDPEALIAVTAELGDADARLRDSSMDWCIAYGRYVNGARLKQVARELGTPAEAIGEYVATVAASGGPAWPMATLPRRDYVPRGKARMESARPTPRLRIRLRAAFGVNARADVLAALLANPRGGVSVAELARRARFAKPSTAFAVDALVLAGLIEVQVSGNERRLFLAQPGALLPGLEAPIEQRDWVSAFAVALAVRRFERRGNLSSSVRAIEARRLVAGLQKEIVSAGLSEPDLDALGTAFASAFDHWAASVGDHLRGDQRA